MLPQFPPIQQEEVKEEEEEDYEQLKIAKYQYF